MSIAFSPPDIAFTNVTFSLKNMNDELTVAEIEALADEEQVRNTPIQLPTVNAAQVARQTTDLMHGTADRGTSLCTLQRSIHKGAMMAMQGSLYTIGTNLRNAGVITLRVVNTGNNTEHVVRFLDREGRERAPSVTIQGQQNTFDFLQEQSDGHFNFDLSAVFSALSRTP
ncbi:MAG: hypothetical protein LBI28_00830 [Treponema sp.]|nr:hypothetical protein [Treponema sp.]